MSALVSLPTLRLGLRVLLGEATTNDAAVTVVPCTLVGCFIFMAHGSSPMRIFRVELMSISQAWGSAAFVRCDLKLLFAGPLMQNEGYMHLLPDS
jgi:hypothetical protein